MRLNENEQYLQCTKESELYLQYAKKNKWYFNMHRMNGDEQDIIVHDH